jgi:hypothetical protein
MSPAAPLDAPAASGVARPRHAGQEVHGHLGRPGRVASAPYVAILAGCAASSPGTRLANSAVVRVFLVAAIVLAMAPAHAVACPHNTACFKSTATMDRLAKRVALGRMGVSTWRVYEREVAVAAPRRYLRAPVVSAPASPVPLEHSLRTHSPQSENEDDMPSIWLELRHKAYARMPHVEQARFTLTVMPVVVAGTFDTVPGIGIGGDF